MSQSDEVEYTVQEVLTHVDFDLLVTKALAEKAVFCPASIENERRKHSKWAYLVHWQGYPVEERTWEPESNLKKCVKLKEYKATLKMPDHHEKFEKTYPAKTWRNMNIARHKVVGSSYLLTVEEKQAKEAARREKLEQMNQKQLKAKEKPRQRITTPDDTEEILKKKKKMRETENNNSEQAMNSEPGPSNLARRSTSPPTVKKVQEETENRNETNTSDDPCCSSEINESTISTDYNKKKALPGLKPLDSNTPRIQKKIVSSPSESHASEQEDSTPASIDIIRPSLESQSSMESSCSTRPPLKLKLKKGTGGQYETVDNTATLERASSENSLLSIGSISPENSVEDDEEKKLALKKSTNDASVELSKLDAQLKKFPVRVDGIRMSRAYSAALNLRKFRRCQSEGVLNDFFNRNADLEIFAKNFEKVAIVEEQRPPHLIKVFQVEPFLKKKTVQNDQDPSMVLDDLAKDNVSKIRQAVSNIRYDKNYLKFLELLAITYSKDDSFRFQQIFLQRFSKKNKDLKSHQFAAIVFILAYCNHRNWKADPKLLSIAESDGQVTWGNIRQQEIQCCENHRKCSWMRLFMELIPYDFRFLETSGRCLHGWQGDDGPFRDDVYFHCMKFGAECQKRVFFAYKKPIGFQEDMIGEWSLDAMHLLAVQYGSLQRIASYVSFGGLDINALATHIPTKRVIRLREYLNDWVKENVKDDTVTDAHRKYYRMLQEMVRLICESLESFVEKEFKDTFLERMEGRWKIIMDLTYPHIVQCSPHSNESNGGDGNSQVLSCLYYPEGAGYQDGLETDVEEEDEENMNKLRKNYRKLQNIVTEKKGRVIVALYRVQIDFSANAEKQYELPIFKIDRSDDDFSIEKLTLLRQIDTGNADDVDIAMIELKPLSSPGCRYFVHEYDDMEAKLIVPGSAHIEIRGEFKTPMTFVTQVFLVKKNF